MYKCKYCTHLQALYNFIDEANEYGYEIVEMAQQNICYTIIYKDNTEVNSWII